MKKVEQISPWLMYSLSGWFSNELLKALSGFKDYFRNLIEYDVLSELSIAEFLPSSTSEIIFPEFINYSKLTRSAMKLSDSVVSCDEKWNGDETVIFGLMVRHNTRRQQKRQKSSRIRYKQRSFICFYGCVVWEDEMKKKILSNAHSNK